MSQTLNCQLKPLLNITGLTLKGTIGLVFPIYMNNIPKAVKDFICKNSFDDVTYLYAISSHMGLPGQSEYSLDRILRENKTHLDQYFDIKMINNTPKGLAPKPLMKLQWEGDITKDKVDEMVLDLNPQLTSIILSIKEENKDFYESIESGQVKIKLMNKLLWRFAGSPKLDFIVDETCNACGTCESVCLSNRIKVTDKPTWIHNKCHYCYACFNYCKKQAIGVKHYQKKLGRYHFPNIDADEIALQK